MMARDLLLTGVKRGQTSEAVAPESFKTAEKIEQKILDSIQRRIFHIKRKIIQGYAFGEWNYLRLREGILKMLVLNVETNLACVYYYDIG